MSYSNSDILNKARNYLRYMVDIRRTIHQHPEVGMQEHQTAKLICSELESIEVPFRKNVGGTGIVAVIKGEGKSEKPVNKVIGLRADMDALTIQEANDVHYKSKVPGVMHACGHDGHVAMLLGAAHILNQMKSEFAGSVKFIFQPAEEGPGGALPMIKDGALKDPKVDAMVGIHLSSSQATGRVGVKPGPVHAAQEEIRIKIKGVGGHAAYPHKSVDAIVLAAQAINNLQTVISRRLDPLKPTVLTIGTIKGGYRHNIIADSVEMTGTLRFLEDPLKQELHKWTEEVLRGVTKPVGGDYEIKYVEGYPATVNDPELYKKVKGYLNDLLTEGYVYDYNEPTMGAEDFSYFAKEVPSMFLRLGAAGNNGEYSKPHHHPEFDIDENAFVQGAASFVKISLDFLNNK